MTKMTYPALNTAVGKIIVETKLNVIDELTNYLDTKVDLDDDIKHAMCEFKEKITAAEKPIEKKKRKLSLFNLYVKDKLPQLKAAHPDIKDGKLMISMASEAWKKEPLALFIKEHSEQVKKEGDIDPVELYNKLKNMYASECISSDDDIKAAIAKVKKGSKKKINN